MVVRVSPAHSDELTSVDFIAISANWPMNNMMQSIHHVRIDPRNADIFISVNGRIYPQNQAVVSVFDSGFILGDGVWEGLSLINGGVPLLRDHIERFYEGAKAIFMEVGISPQELVQLLSDCVDATRCGTASTSA